MLKTLKNLMANILEWPITYTIPIALSTVVSIALLFDNSSNIASVFVVASIGILFALQAHFGTAIIKDIVNGFIIMYLVSLYTNLIMSIHGYVTQPFLISLACITLFLAQTYSNKNHTAGLRSRAFWCSVLTFMIVSFKIASTLSNVSYLITEIIGLVVLVVFIFSWRMWIFKSKKTKITPPTIIKSEVLESFQFVYINNQLDVSKSVWFNGEFNEEINAYPYIYNEVIKAKENNLTLILISEFTTSNIYDVGEIQLNKSTKLPYLYLEAKESNYVADTIARFVDELSLKKQNKA